MNIQGHGGQDNNIKINFIEDFSVTTNLMGPNKKALDKLKNIISEIQHYPPQSYEPYLSNLKSFIFKNYKINNNVLLGNGASELIDLLLRSIKTKTWRPSKSTVQFLEYERSCTLTNKEKTNWNNKKSKLLCLINPNNPTGDYLNIDEMKKYIIDNCEEDTYVVVDESMQMWLGENWRSDSLVSQTKWIEEMASKKIYIYIIHSWTKIFSCTGIRYGSLICPTKESYNKLLSMKPPWSVNILALNYVDYCIKDNLYLENTWKKTKILRKNQIEKLSNMFSQWKFYGKNFLSWIWIDTGNESISKMAYDLCKYNGTPIRLGQMGYKMKNYIRIAVREKESFDILCKGLLNLKKFLISNNIKKINYHIDIDSDIIKGFEWIDIKKIKSHEKFIEDRHNKLYQYIKSVDNSCSIPAIIICSETYTIIDGHHRFSVMKKLGIKKCPCLLINYKNKNIIVNPYKNIEKEEVINAGLSEKKLLPKSTCHMIKDNKNSLHPIIVLSPTIFIPTQNE
jgi:histidinol-phosphate/aromatic aminotransferase/cobyric acid decarboxylase-like protein